MYFNDLVASYDNERSKRGIFHDLMRYRVHEILLVASLYDSFILESDGDLSEQIYGEFYRLNLTSSPRVSCAYTPDSAREMVNETNFDMIVLMTGLDFENPLTLASQLKAIRPDVPILLLVMNNSSLSFLNMASVEKTHAIDRVFVWNGYSKLFVGMIKYVEDMHNIGNDTRVGMVRVILLIEDSVRYYSRYLPLLYSVVTKQVQQLIEEEKSIEIYKVLKMRARPKIVLATNYEEALYLYKKYESFLLTVISDVRFNKDGKENSEAGFLFIDEIKKRRADIPVVIQSSETENREKAYSIGASFIDKNSTKLARELTTFFQVQLGFGPFVFRDNSGKELARAKNIIEFKHEISVLNDESLLYHATRNHFSSWLMARGEVSFAWLFRNYETEDFQTPDELRNFIVRALDKLRSEKSKGMIPAVGDINPDAVLCRLADGSVGGKGRGLAFIKSLIDNMAFSKLVTNMEIKLPRTAFIGIEEFEKFMDQNALWSVCDTSMSEIEIRKLFITKALHEEFVERLKMFLQTTNKPLAVRSSGLFEDMLMIPFSGVYDTYILPNNQETLEIRLEKLCDAIKMIYASLYSNTARSYFDAASYKIEEERMAIVLQELVGSQNGSYYYPLIAGTAQSYNYYPVSYVKSEDGLCLAALGLGSYVVDGSEAHRFCPRYPKMDIVAQGRNNFGASQRWFYALNLELRDFDLVCGENATLSKLDISEAEKNPHFKDIVSTWSIADDRIEPGLSVKGPRILDFAPALKCSSFPFASTVELVLDVCSRSMGLPVEIEYAINFDGENNAPIFYLLQIKPLIRLSDKVDIDLENIDKNNTLVISKKCMGNGKITGVTDIVFIDPEHWNKSETEEIALELGKINEKLKAENRYCVLIGPGRWGTRDRWIGIPVNFSQISRAKAIVEAELPDFQVEPSLGSHFFHNVTSMHIGYFSTSLANSFINWKLLSKLPIEEETKHCIHARVNNELEILMDGRQTQGCISLSL